MLTSSDRTNVSPLLSFHKLSYFHAWHAYVVAQVHRPNTKLIFVSMSRPTWGLAFVGYKPLEL